VAKRPAKTPTPEQPEVEFYGEKFALPERTGSMALLRFAHLSEDGGYTDLEEKAAIYDLLEACIAPADWTRFQAAAKKHRATEDELVSVIGAVLVALSGRPTSRSAGSSGTPGVAGPSSTSTPAERAIAQLAGRPDLQNVVDMQQRTLTG
jgi:hypothetical protein